MMDNFKVSIILPVYNEEKAVAKSIETVCQYFDKQPYDYEVIAVNDGSFDNTLKILTELGPALPKIKILSYQKNRGRGYAVKRGMENATGDYLMFFDIDMAVPLETIQKFIDACRNQNFDVAIGTRKHKEAVIIKHQPFYREFLGKGYIFITNLILQTSYSDITCGFKCFKKESAQKIFSIQQVERWGADAEILFLIKKWGLSVKEIPVIWKDDPASKVKVIKDIIFSFYELIKIRFLYMNRKIFLGLGIIFLVGLFLRIIGLNFGLCSTTHTLTTFHPDESITLYSLEKMEPEKFNFYPGDALFWGSLQIYLQGAVTKFMEITGLVKTNGRDFLKNNLHEADKLYIIARIITILFGSFAILIFYRISRFYFELNWSLMACLLFAVSYLPVLTSFYARPDSIMLFWGLCSVYFSLLILENNLLKYYLLSGIFIGLAASSKYNGILFTGLLVIVHFYLGWKNKNIFLYFSRLLLAGIVSLLVFLMVNPYSLLRFNDFVGYVSGMAAKGKWNENILQGYVNYFRDTLPVSVGWPVFIMAILGIIISIKKPKNMETPILIFTLLYLIFFAPPEDQALNYCLIAIPFLLIFSVKGFSIVPGGVFRKILVIFTLLYAFGYTLYFKSFYLRKSTHESASEWVLNNIPENSTIVISKSDFWTPPVIKQYEPLYKILAGDSPQSNLSKALLKLEKIMPQGDYLILTSFEYFNFLFRYRTEKYPEENRIIKQIFQKYKELKRFSRQPSIFALPFGSKHLPEIMFGNPAIHIFKIRNSTPYTLYPIP